MTFGSGHRQGSIDGMIRYNDSQWPLLQTTVDDLPTDSELEDFLLDASAMLMRGTPYVWLIALQHSKPIPPEHTVRYADWIRTNRHALALTCAGGCLVVPTMIGRLGVRATFLLQPPPVPHTVLASYDAGLTWCIKRLIEVGEAVPSSLRESAPQLSYGQKAQRRRS